MAELVTEPVAEPVTELGAKNGVVWRGFSVARFEAAILEASSRRCISWRARCLRICSAWRRFFASSSMALRRAAICSAASRWAWRWCSKIRWRSPSRARFLASSAAWYSDNSCFAASIRRWFRFLRRFCSSIWCLIASRRAISWRASFRRSSSRSVGSGAAARLALRTGAKSMRLRAAGVANGWPWVLDSSCINLLFSFYIILDFLNFENLHERFILIGGWGFYLRQIGIYLLSRVFYDRSEFIYYLGFYFTTDWILTA